MLWLDSTYPTDSTSLGAARGSCATSSGVPSDVESAQASSKVIYSNIKFGSINSTFTYTSVHGGGSSGSSTSTTSTKTSTTLTTSIKTSTSTSTKTTTTSSSGATQTHYGQCGGIGWTGATACASPYTCKVQNAWYSQCL